MATVPRATPRAPRDHRITAGDHRQRDADPAIHAFPTIPTWWRPMAVCTAIRVTPEAHRYSDVFQEISRYGAARVSLSMSQSARGRILVRRTPPSQQAPCATMKVADAPTSRYREERAVVSSHGSVDDGMTFAGAACLPRPSQTHTRTHARHLAHRAARTSPRGYARSVARGPRLRHEQGCPARSPSKPRSASLARRRDATRPRGAQARRDGVVRGPQGLRARRGLHCLRFRDACDRSTVVRPSSPEVPARSPASHVPPIRSARPARARRPIREVCRSPPRPHPELPSWRSPGSLAGPA